MLTNKLWFYKYRYWLLNTYATGELNEEDKNNLFCKKFFKTQDINLGKITYKIRQLYNEGEYNFGQIGKSTKAYLNEDTGTLIEPIEADDNPFLYYFSIARKGYQVIYVQHDYRNILGTTSQSIERKLSEIANQAASHLIVTINSIVSESSFWESVHYFNIIDKIEFTFTRPNFLECDESLEKVLNDLKMGINSDILSVGYTGLKGLNIQDSNEEIKAQASYSSEYSGDWKIKGRKHEQSKQETRTKANVFRAVHIELPRLIVTAKEKFLWIMKQIDDQDIDKNN